MYTHSRLGVLQVILWCNTGLFLPRVLEVCMMVHLCCCSGFPSSPMMSLLESWGRMGKAIDRTETESSAVLLCRAGHTVRQLNRCRALGQPTHSLTRVLSLLMHSHIMATFPPSQPRTETQCPHAHFAQGL